jgi:hypothetical protein
MNEFNSLLRVVGALASACAFAATSPGVAAPREASRVIMAANYSASGTHQCRADNGDAHRCVVTGVVFGNCVDAQSSLRSQDCCPSTRVCARDAQGRETQCRGGGSSAGFTMNYCISGQ